MLVDMGSSVNILDEEEYSKVGRPRLLEKNKSRELVPYGGGKIPVLGTCDLMLETEKSYDVFTFYVVKGDRWFSVRISYSYKSRDNPDNL